MGFKRFVLEGIMRTLILSAAVAAGLTIAGCGGDESGDITADSSPKKIADAYISEMTKVADALEGIESAEDTEAVAAVIQSASLALDDMTEALDGEISGMKAMRILGARAGDFMEVQQRIAASMGKLSMQDPEMMERLAEEMEKLPSP